MPTYVSVGWGQVTTGKSLLNLRLIIYMANYDIYATISRLRPRPLESYQ